MTPSSPTFVKAFLTTRFGHDPIALSVHQLKQRHKEILRLREKGDYTTAERFGWLSLAGLVLGVPRSIEIDVTSPVNQPRYLHRPPPAATERRHSDALSLEVQVVDDSTGQNFVRLACSNEGFATIDGVPVAIEAIHDDLRELLQGMLS